MEVEHAIGVLQACFVIARYSYMVDVSDAMDHAQYDHQQRARCSDG
jgi:hypothetical protein